MLSKSSAVMPHNANASAYATCAWCASMYCITWQPMSRLVKCETAEFTLPFLDTLRNKSGVV